DHEAVFIFSDARNETVGRNPVAACREYGNAVDDEHETLARFVALLSQLERANSGACRVLVCELAVDECARAEAVEWLSPESVGPPQRRMRDEEVESDFVNSRVEVDLSFLGDEFIAQII